MNIKITTCDSGDWTIVEIDGKEVASGHSISNHDWLGILSEYFDADIEMDCISDEEMEMRS